MVAWKCDEGRGGHRSPPLPPPPAVGHRCFVTVFYWRCLAGEKKKPQTQSSLFFRTNFPVGGGLPTVPSTSRLLSYLFNRRVFFRFVRIVLSSAYCLLSRYYPDGEPHRVFREKRGKFRYFSVRIPIGDDNRYGKTIENIGLFFLFFCRLYRAVHQ